MLEAKRGMINIIVRFFTSHPHSIGETYTKHFHFAFRNGCRLLFSGIACIIHSIFPFLFVTIASDTVRKINQELVERNSKASLDDEKNY